MDKRELGPVFRERLQTLFAASGATRAAFAKSIGVDRSALTQLLSGPVDPPSPRRHAAQHLRALFRQPRLAARPLAGRDARGGDQAGAGDRRGRRCQQRHAARALAQGGDRLQDPLRAGAGSGPAAHARRHRLRIFRPRRAEPLMAAAQRRVPPRLQPPPGDRHGGLHAAPAAGAAGGGQGPLARPRSRGAPGAARLHGRPGRRALSELSAVPLRPAADLSRSPTRCSARSARRSSSAKCTWC